MPPDRYFVLGNPVAHSQSPFIHARFAEQTGEHLIYERRLCPLEDFGASVRALAADPDGGPVRGCNVTVPFKVQAIHLAAHIGARARLAGAANVLRFDADGWHAENTDGSGLMRDLVHNEGLVLAGRRVLLAGAGGAAAGVLGPLLEQGPAQVLVVNRTAARAERLVHTHAQAASAQGVDLRAVAADALDPVIGTAGIDLVINATASSLAGDATPLPALRLATGASAVDLMYGPSAQGFLSWARQQGAQHVVDGLGMLVEQAADAFQWWRGVRPQTAPVLTALRTRLAAAAGAAA